MLICCVGGARNTGTNSEQGFEIQRFVSVLNTRQTGVQVDVALKEMYWQLLLLVRSSLCYPSEIFSLY